MGRSRLERYGPHRAQVAELWEPEGLAPADGWPVAVLVHGGFWRHRYTRRLMQPLSADLAKRGVAAWNIEYRRIGGHSGGGWPATFDDVTAAVAHLDLARGREALDCSRVVLVGHSAGGHLALWAAAPVPRPASLRIAGVVALAPVSDLELAARTGVGSGAVDALMGGGPDDVAERYAAGSPAARLPLGVRQVLVHGTDDESVPFSMSERYVRLAAGAGDDVVLEALSGVTHMPLIKPRTAAWAAARAHVLQLAGVGRD